LGQENPFLTTAATQIGRGKLAEEAYGDIEIMEVDWVTGVYISGRTQSR
jgi:hypothetical protein